MVLYELGLNTKKKKEKKKKDIDHHQNFPPSCLVQLPKTKVFFFSSVKTDLKNLCTKNVNSIHIFLEVFNKLIKKEIFGGSYCQHIIHVHKTVVFKLILNDTFRNVSPFPKIK